jgi:outer membrane protein assembly factor BamB
MAASEDLVVASVRPDSRGAPTLLALHVADGAEAWRYQPSGSVLDLGGPSVDGDAVFVVASDASVRALSLVDGSQRWASTIYSPTAGAPPAVSADAVYVTDQSGTVYAFDAASGVERWRFATNHFTVAPPIATSSAVLQPANDGSITAIDRSSGHQIWSAAVTDAVVFGLAASGESIVASHTGSAPGLVGLSPDPSGTLQDLPSPTSADPAGLLLGWLLAAVPLVALFVWLGRLLERRMGPAELGEVSDDVVDPWEADLEGDES